MFCNDDIKEIKYTIFHRLNECKDALLFDEDDVILRCEIEMNDGAKITSEIVPVGDKIIADNVDEIVYYHACNYPMDLRELIKNHEIYDSKIYDVVQNNTFMLTVQDDNGFMDKEYVDIEFDFYDFSEGQLCDTVKKMTMTEVNKYLF